MKRDEEKMTHGELQIIKRLDGIRMCLYIIIAIIGAILGMVWIP